LFLKKGKKMSKTLMHMSKGQWEAIKDLKKKPNTGYANSMKFETNRRAYWKSRVQTGKC
jgi:hypothetical protein